MSSPTDTPVHPVAAPGEPARPRRHYVYWVLGAVLAVVAVYSMYYSSYHGFLDLDVYRIGVRTWWHGGDMYGSLPATQAGISLPFIYPPFAALALSPLVLPSFHLAGQLNFGLGVLGLGFTMYLAARRLAPKTHWSTAIAIAGMLLPLAIWVEPVRETIGFGQVNLILMALVAADVLGKDGGRWPRGLGVGLAAAIKLTPAVFLLYFLLRKDWRASVTSVVTGVVATGIGFAVLPGESMRYWFGGLAGAGNLSGSPYAMNQTLLAVFTRMPALASWAQNALWLVLALLMLVVAIAGVWRALYDPVHGEQRVLAVVITAAAGLVISPTSWTHHYVWIVVALPVAVYYAVTRRSVCWFATAAVSAAVFFVGVPGLLPRNNEVELTWSAWQHLPGNSYTLLVVVLLVAWGVPALRPATRAGLAALSARRDDRAEVPAQQIPDDVRTAEPSPAE